MLVFPPRNPPATGNKQPAAGTEKDTLTHTHTRWATNSAPLYVFDWVGEVGAGEAFPAAHGTWARIPPAAELLLLRVLRYAERAAHAAGGGVVEACLVRVMEACATHTHTPHPTPTPTLNPHPSPSPSPTPHPSPKQR